MGISLDFLRNTFVNGFGWSSFADDGCHLLSEFNQLLFYRISPSQLVTNSRTVSLEPIAFLVMTIPSIMFCPPPHPHNLDFFFFPLATMSGLSVWKPAYVGGNYPAIWPSLEILVFQSGRQVGQSPCCSLETCPWTPFFSLLSCSFLCQRDLDSNRGCPAPATCFPGPNRDEVILARLFFTKLMLTSGNHCVFSKCS